MVSWYNWLKLQYLQHCLIHVQPLNLFLHSYSSSIWSLMFHHVTRHTTLAIDGHFTTHYHSYMPSSLHVHCVSSCSWVDAQIINLNMIIWVVFVSHAILISVFRVVQRTMKRWGKGALPAFLNGLGKSNMSRKLMVDLAIGNKSSGGVSRKLLVAAFQKILIWVEDHVPNFWDSACEKIHWMQKENHKKIVFS